MFRKLFLVIILIASLFLMPACNNQLHELDREYTYGIVYTSNIQNKSKIILFSKEWNQLKEIELDVGGLREYTKYKNKIYIPVLGIPSNPGDTIMEFNLETNDIRHLKTNLLPTKATVNNDFLYVIHNSSMEYGIVTKIDIEKNQVINKVKLNNVLRGINAENQYVYVIGDNPIKHNQVIYKLDSNLEEIEQINNQYTAFPTDSEFINDKFIVINVAKYDFSGPTDRYIELDVNTNHLNLVNLEKYAPNRIFNLKDSLVITHYDPPSRTGNSVSVINKESGNQTSYSLKNNIFRSNITKDKLISLEESNIYEYSLENFRLLNTYEIKTYEDFVVNDFFIYSDSY